ncbi:hypothetical protein CSAL01_04605 [Colletotrichum salicis]|uniref:Uncharacterized protein n=1 Tax=Colletotrichum salicis TaxID=1209931 RepID=A0A135S6R5_9PEZI|nr:hypothetical protein CSAL01_04605 [Colletotrichum salicis]
MKERKFTQPCDSTEPREEDILKLHNSKSSSRPGCRESPVDSRRNRAQSSLYIKQKENKAAPDSGICTELSKMSGETLNPGNCPSVRDQCHHGKNPSSPRFKLRQEQLVAEVKGMYAGLVMVESKCIGVDNAQNSSSASESNPKFNNEQLQALIALHRTLLHEHHDFFLASQHPSASPALRRLPYAHSKLLGTLYEGGTSRNGASS